MILSIILYHAVLIYKSEAKTHRKTVSRRWNESWMWKWILVDRTITSGLIDYKAKCDSKEDTCFTQNNSKGSFRSEKLSLLCLNKLHER